MADVLAVFRRGWTQFWSHGGIRGALFHLLRTSELKTGNLVGEDKYGNKYYEDKQYFFGGLCKSVDSDEEEEVRTSDSSTATAGGTSLVLAPTPSPPSRDDGRHRWVEYTEEMNGKNTYWEVDGSMIPPEWHHWIHCFTEHPPTTHPPVERKFIFKTHQFNKSGTPGQYVPYSTTRKKIHEWVPQQSSK